MRPRLIELCLQTAGVWEMKNKGILALPKAIGSVTAFHIQEEIGEKTPVRFLALVQVLDGGERFDAQVVDESGAVHLMVTGYQTVALPNALSMPVS